jgi:hypothetical protein
MNITSIKCSSANLYNDRKTDNTNINISFHGRESAFADKVADKAGCAGNALLLVILSPLVLIASLLRNPKESKIDSITKRMQSEYENHCGDFNFFEEDINEMNELLNKYSKNDNYSQFVKEGMEFLRQNFENNQGACDQGKRLKPFENKVIIWHIFLDTINGAAKAAISKNEQRIDYKETLDKNILAAREIIQKKSS